MKRFSLDRNSPPDVPSLALRGNRANLRYDDAWIAARPELPAVDDCTLAKQRITRLPALPSCERLELESMPQLQSLPGIESMLKLSSLTLCDMDGLDLEVVFEQLGELPDLVRLQLSGDWLAKLPKTTSKLHSLLEIWICDSPRLDFAGAFKQLGKLPFLRAMSLFQHTRVTLPDAFAPLTQVRELEMAFDMTFLPPSIGKMASLETLIADRNKFTELPASFGKLSKLRLLAVAGKGITTVPDALGNCTALESLSLGKTAIKTLPASLGRLVNLRELWLPAKVKELPPELYALRPTRVFPDALASHFTMRDEVETLDVEDLTLDDRAGIPDDLGQPTVLQVRIDDLDRPLPQLAKLTQLRHLDCRVPRLAYVLPYITAPLEILEITSDEARLPTNTLARFPTLRWLALWIGTPKVPSELRTLVGLRGLELFTEAPSLAPLGALDALEQLRLDATNATAIPVGAVGKLVELALKMPKLRALPAMPALVELSLEVGKHTELAALGKLGALKTLTVVSADLPALCAALGGRPLESLELRLNVDALPPEIGLLTGVKKLVLPTGIATLPAEFAQCTALRELYFRSYMTSVEASSISALLPKGRWKKELRRGRLNFTRRA